MSQGGREEELEGLSKRRRLISLLDQLGFVCSLFLFIFYFLRKFLKDTVETEVMKYMSQRNFFLKDHILSYLK